MKRLLLVLITLAFAAALCAAPPAQEAQPDVVAHGAEKVAQDVAHDGEHEKTYFGVPGSILKFVNMVLFLGLLFFLLRKPVRAAFRQRGEAIRSELAEAKQRRAKADQVAGDIESRLAEMEREIAALRKRAAEEGDRQRRELIEAAEKESEKLLTAARNDVDLRVKQARAELTELAGALATERARAIIETKITDADRARIFEESVRQIEEASR